VAWKTFEVLIVVIVTYAWNFLDVQNSQYEDRNVLNKHVCELPLCELKACCFPGMEFLVIRYSQ